MIIMKTSMRKIQFAILALAMVTVFASCSKDEDTNMPDSKNIVQTASSDPQFSLLTAALTKAGLVCTGGHRSFHRVRTNK
jgi:hypothetical protein